MIFHLLMEFKLIPLGKLFNVFGNKAVRVNIKAKDKENPNIPIIGLINSPSDASISTLPTIGAVQEKLIRTKVKAIKNIPI